MSKKDKEKLSEELDNDKLNINKSVFQVNREMHEKALKEQEEKQLELHRLHEEKEKKKREEYEKKILEEKKELIRLKQGIIEESEMIHEEHEEEVKLTIPQKIGNFFYHNKWWLGVGAVFVMIFAYLIYSFVTKPRPDMVVLVIGEMGEIGNSENLDDYVAGFAGDFNKNGKTEVSIYYIPYSEDSYKNYANGVDTKMTTQLSSADAVIIIGNEKVKDVLSPENNLVDLSEIYPDNPHIDKYFFELDDTDFAQRIGVDKDAVKDTYLAIRRPRRLLYSDQDDMQETYDRDFPVFEGIINDLS